MSNTKIHQTAYISPKCTIGEDTSIGAFTIIHDNVMLGKNVEIGSFCEIGVSNHLSEHQNLIIGDNSIIRSHSVFYEGSIFGENLITGHRVTVREKINAGKNLKIGTLSDLQGHCEIGDYVRMHSNVHIGQKSQIGSFVWIYPYVVLTNDPHPPSDLLKGVIVEDFVVIATMSVILPGVTLGKGCLIGAHSLVAKNVEEGILCVGSPAKSIFPARKIKLQNGSNRPAYPWNKHFFRGYPDDIVNQWNNEN